MNTISKLIVAGVLSLGLFITQSCVKDDDYSTPPLDCPEKPAANITIKDLLAQAEAKTLNLDANGMIADDLIVEGVIITSDESGNISNTISFQDKAESATAGIQIELAERPLYGTYPIGSTIQVKLKGLKVAYDRGTYRIGTKLTGSQATTYDLDRIPKDLRTKVFIKYCDAIQTIKPKEVNSIEEALKPENLNTLVTINNVQFKSPETAVSYYPLGSTSTADNVRLMDENGEETDLRTSSYANFKETKLPTGSGSITVLVSRYNSAYQVFIRDTNDVKFDQPRFVVIPKGTVEINGSKEGFESAVKNNYNTADMTFNTGIWTVSDGSVFESADGDLKSSGIGSVRLRGKSATEGFIQTKFYTTGLKTLKLYFGGANFSEGADADKEIKLEVLVSTDFGATWKSLGEKEGIRGTMSLLEFPVNAAANDKVIVKFVNKSFLRSTDARLRVNIDDVEFVK